MKGEQAPPGCKCQTDMTIKQFYETIDADYEEILTRLGSENLVKKIVLRFLTDPTFAEFEKAYDAKDASKAFLEIHTPKGIASNLGFDKLYEPVYRLTEKLRPRDFSLEGIDALYQEVKNQYYLVLDALKQVK